MRHTEYIKVGSAVVVRSYTSGVFVGRLVGGEAGTVVLGERRWLRRWEGVGGEGSVYDLVKSDKTPSRRGPLQDGVCTLQQADVMTISEECYQRLAHG